MASFCVTCCGGRTEAAFEELRDARMSEAAKSEKEQQEAEKEQRELEQELAATSAKLEAGRADREQRLETERQALQGAEERKRQIRQVGQLDSWETAEGQAGREPLLHQAIGMLQESQRQVKQNHRKEVASMYHDHIQQLFSQKLDRERDVAEAEARLESVRAKFQQLEDKLQDTYRAKQLATDAKPDLGPEVEAEPGAVITHSLGPLSKAVGELKAANDGGVAAFFEGVIRHHEEVRDETAARVKLAEETLWVEKARLQEVVQEMSSIYKKLEALGIIKPVDEEIKRLSEIAGATR